MKKGETAQWEKLNYEDFLKLISHLILIPFWLNLLKLKFMTLLSAEFKNKSWHQKKLIDNEKKPIKLKQLKENEISPKKKFRWKPNDGRCFRATNKQTHVSHSYVENLK